MKIKKTLLSTIVISCLLVSFTGLGFTKNIVYPTTFGAKGDNKTDNAKYIQEAVDQCYLKGGGTVILEKGIFLSSPIILKSNVHLKIDKTAILKAVDYKTYPNNSNPSNFISAEKSSNIAIYGGGKIEGNGSNWWKVFKKLKTNGKEIKRPRLIYFTDCNNIIFNNLTLVDSPSFHIVPHGCNNVLISNITINSDSRSPNTDGIDPSHSSNVLIYKCRISTGDDNIAIKAEYGKSQNIYVVDTDFGHGHGMSIGSETNFGISNVIVYNCRFNNTTNGIRIKSPQGSGGKVENIFYIDIKMDNVHTALEISSYYPESKIPFPKSTENENDNNQKILDVRNILFSNIYAKNVLKHGGYITATPQIHAENIILNNVTMEIKGKGLEIENANVYFKNVNFISNGSDELLLGENATITYLPPFIIPKNILVFFK